MAGAIAQTWPKDIRAAIVTAIVDNDHTITTALKLAKAGQLPGLPKRLGDQAPARTTIREWVIKENRDRHRAAANEIAGKTATEVLETLRVKDMVGLEVELAAILASPVGRRNLKRWAELRDMLYKHTPKDSRATPNGTGASGEHTTPEPPDNGTPTLAERVAGKARPTRNDNTPRNGDASNAEQPHHDTHNGHNNDRSLVVERGEAEPAHA